MKELMMGFAAVNLLFTPAAFAAEKGRKDDPVHLRKDVADHQAMADAHFKAARCLDTGKPEKECHAQLARDCKGLAPGKYCGMRHRR